MCVRYVEGIQIRRICLLYLSFLLFISIDNRTYYCIDVGTLMGQSLSGLGKLLKMPSGCGEQNMLHFAPDVYILKYLNATGQTAGSIVTKAKRFINAGIVDPIEK